MDDIKNETVRPSALADEQVMNMNTQYHELSAKAEHLYRFVNQFKASFHRPRDYSGHYINMVEVHDLTYIDRSSGHYSNANRKVYAAHPRCSVAGFVKIGKQQPDPAGAESG